MDSSKPYRDVTTSLQIGNINSKSDAEKVFLSLFYKAGEQKDDLTGMYKAAYEIMFDHEITPYIDFNNLLYVDQMFAELGIVRYSSPYIPDPTDSCYVKLFAGDFCHCEEKQFGDGFESFEVVVFGADMRPMEPSIMIPQLLDLGLRIGDYEHITEDSIVDTVWPSLKMYTNDELTRLLFGF